MRVKLLRHAVGNAQGFDEADVRRVAEEMCFGFMSGPSAGLFNLRCPAAPECRP